MTRFCIFSHWWLFLLSFTAKQQAEDLTVQKILSSSSAIYRTDDMFMSQKLQRAKKVIALTSPSLPQIHFQSGLEHFKMVYNYICNIAQLIEAEI